MKPLKFWKYIGYVAGATLAVCVTFYLFLCLLFTTG